MMTYGTYQQSGVNALLNDNQLCINQYFCNKKGKLPHRVSHLCETVLCSSSNLTLSNLNFTHPLLHHHQTNVNSSVHYIALPFLLMEHIIYQDITHNTLHLHCLLFTPLLNTCRNKQTFKHSIEKKLINKKIRFNTHPFKEKRI